MAVIIDGTTGITTPSDSITGNLTFTGTGNRITGDFSNATVASRVAFQSSTTNGNSFIPIIPNGTALSSGIISYNNSDPTNSAFVAAQIVGTTETRITSGIAGTGSYLPMNFFTGGSERVRIDTAGNVGIGTTSPNARLEALSSTAGAEISRFEGSYSGSGSVALTNWRRSGGAVASVMRYNDANTNMEFGTTTSHSQAFLTNNAERMRIDSSGIVQIGGTTARTTQAKLELTSATNTALSFYMYKTSQVEMAMGFKSSTDTNFYIGTGSSSVGINGVYLANTGTSWISNSDERLKENLVPITDAISKVSTLRSVIGNFIADESKTPRPFLIAQDVQQVLPEAIGKNEIDGIEYLGVSYTDTIPLLVAAIKEQQTLITAMTARIEALEAK